MIITSTSLINLTLEKLLDASRNCRITALVGSTTPLAVNEFRELGVDLLSGVIVKDPKATPLWARFYEIGTNRPIFSGRDGVIKYRVAEIEAERRNGYAWHGSWGASVLTQWPKWSAANTSSNSAPRPGK